jgi:hypothetical protein
MRWTDQAQLRDHQHLADGVSNHRVEGVAPRPALLLFLLLKIL